MIKRRVTAVGFGEANCHTFRATGITAYLLNGGTLERAKAIAAHESPRTTTSAASFLEASIVLESRHGADGVRLLDLLIESAGIERARPSPLMVIDTSAFLAILQDEPDRPSFTKAIAAAAVRRNPPGPAHRDPGRGAQRGARGAPVIPENIVSGPSITHWELRAPAPELVELVGQRSARLFSSKSFQMVPNGGGDCRGLRLSGQQRQLGGQPLCFSVSDVERHNYTYGTTPIHVASNVTLTRVGQLGHTLFSLVAI